MKYLAALIALCSAFICLGFGQYAHAAPTCTLCIMEVQTQGVHGEEDQDFVVVANLSGASVAASSSNPIRLQYYNDQGVAGSSVVIASTSIPKDQVYVLASNTLAPVNAAALTLNLSLYSGGGSLQLFRGTTTYDKVGWGSAVIAEGLSAPAPTAAATLARNRVNGTIQDTNNNSQDFAIRELGCQGVELSEIQPFVVDTIGQSIDAWVEIRGASSGQGDCTLVTKVGDAYTITAEDLPTEGQIGVVARGVNASDERVPLHLGEVSGQMWFVATSDYANVRIPITTQAYANLENGQSYALIDGIWRRTFSPTPGLDNIYSASAEIQNDPNACRSIRISELLPNPTGEDAGHEWLEITNESDEPASLQSCLVVVGGVEYRFLPDDMMGSHEWRAIYDFYDGDQKPKTLSLRNSESTLVAFQRLIAGGATETLQSFEYADAIEGQSWSRFTDGWRWQASPTPSLDNATLPSENSDPGPTEFPAVGQPPSQQEQPALTGVSITEILPNPAAPGTDEADEYVELFNASDEPAILRGYKLQTGNSYNYSFAFTDQVIPPKSYSMITSGESSISLANSGGRARLIGADGTVVYETMSYVDAPEGHAWAFLDGGWKWTASPTPGADNVLKTPLLTALSKSKAVSAPKSSGAVKSVSKTSAPTAKAPKTSSASTTKPDNSEDKQAVTVPPLHPLILAVVGGLGVLYAAYEYRQDIANKIYQFRRNRKDRRANRTPLEGR